MRGKSVVLSSALGSFSEEEEEEDELDTFPTRLVSAAATRSGTSTFAAANATATAARSGNPAVPAPAPIASSARDRLGFDAEIDSSDDEDNEPRILSSTGLTTGDEGQSFDENEDVPLWDLQRSSLPPTNSQAPPRESSNLLAGTVTSANDNVVVKAEAAGSGSKNPAMPAAPGRQATPAGLSRTSVKLKRASPLVPVPRLSHAQIGFLAPVYSKSYKPEGSENMKEAAFDTALAVSMTGRVACMGTVDEGVPGLRTGSQIEFRSLTDDATPSQIEKVQGVARLTTRVVAIASSTVKEFGSGFQASLVTVGEGMRTHRICHLEARPHKFGARCISPFIRTSEEDPYSVDFATGGADGVVYRWVGNSVGGEARSAPLYSLHSGNAVGALAFLNKRKLMMSASAGRVVGYDPGSLSMACSWPTSNSIVHLQRTPNPDLVLATADRQDYEQFKMYDITGKSGAFSRPVLTFGWLHNKRYRVPMGKGCFHPVRQSIFAHGAEDGHIRVWDLRYPKDPLLVAEVGDEPIVDVLWRASPEPGMQEMLYTATRRGARMVEFDMLKA